MAREGQGGEGQPAGPPGDTPTEVRPAPAARTEETPLPVVPEPVPAAPLPPPPTVITVETQPVASIGDRLVAQLVDGMLGFGLAFVLAFLLVPWMDYLNWRPIDHRLVGIAAAVLLTGLALLIYF